MDATTSAIIIIVFVYSIFSGFGGNNANQPPQITLTPKETVAAPAPAPAVSLPVSAKYVEGQKQPIANYIAGFRKPDQAVEIAEAIDAHSKTYDVNPKLVAALMRRESGFNPRALSKSGAMGLGQLLPSTCKTTGVKNGYDISDNTKGTVRYMKYLLDKFKNYAEPVKFALAGYLEGPNGVARNKAYKTVTGKYIDDILVIYNKI